MKSSFPIAARLAGLAICVMLSGVVMAQTSTEPAGSPVDPTAATTAMTAPAGTMSKGDIKDQRKQQKKDEAAAKANAKAAKATAKSKEANDKALQAQEKAGQVTQTPPASTAPASLRVHRSRLQRRRRPRSRSLRRRLSSRKDCLRRGCRVWPSFFCISAGAFNPFHLRGGLLDPDLEEGWSLDPF